MALLILKKDLIEVISAFSILKFDVTHCANGVVVSSPVRIGSLAEAIEWEPSILASHNHLPEIAENAICNPGEK